MIRASKRIQSFSESVIREMTRLAVEYDAINLAQGMPDDDPPQELIEAAVDALRNGHNQYSFTWGAPPLRQAIAEHYSKRWEVEVDPDTEVTVTLGATEAVIASLLSTVDPGDEVILFEPFYENYLPGAHLATATPKFVTLTPPDFRIEQERLEQVITPRSRVLVLNTPNNPTGRVFSLNELEAVAEVCRRHNLVLISDEIYEYITYDGHRHISPATLPGMRDRTITISGLSKTYSATGWRIGYAVAAPRLTDGLRKVHDFNTACAPTPLQVAAVAAFSLPERYYYNLAKRYQEKRDHLARILQGAGLSVTLPQGTYFLFADATPWGFPDSFKAAEFLASSAGVACVPGGVYFVPEREPAPLLRFCFCKGESLLDQVGRQIEASLVGKGR